MSDRAKYRKIAVMLSSVATTAAMALMLSGQANAASSISYFLDQSNHLPDDRNYLKVTINDEGGTINFTLQPFDSLSDPSKYTLDIGRFGFNGAELNKNNITGLPDGWKLKNEKNIAGFGRYENVLFGKPLTGPLTFSIVGIDGDSIYSYAKSHDGGNGLFFSAMANGTCKHCGEHGHRYSRSGTFGGSSIDTFRLDNASGSNGSFTLGNGTTLTANSEYIGSSGGSSGTGSFTQTGGTNTISGNLVLGDSSDSSGSYNLSGGSLSAADETVGGTGTGTFTQTGGTHTVSNTLTIAAQPGSSGSYNLQGGTLTVNGGITNNANGSFNVGAGTTATVGGAGFVNHGLLKGAGTIAGNVTSDGAVGPGNSPGALSIAGNYTQSASGSLDVQIGGLLAGTEHDVLHVSGIATLDGTLNVSLVDLGGGLFAPHAGDSFDILTAELLQGSFSSLSYAALLDPNLTWHIDYLTDAIGTTDVVRLSVVSAVPIPAAVWLFGSGLLGLIGIAKRKKA